MGCCAIVELVRRARRRLLWEGMIGQMVFACSLLMGSAILLLVAGTELLDWRWLALISALSLSAGLYRLLRRIPSRYGTAQIVDRAAGLCDALSTAVYFEQSGGKGSAEIVAAQRSEAENRARGVDLRQVLPYRVPKAAFPLLGLALVATSLFALRYGLERRIDLKPPLARLLFPWLPGSPELHAAIPRSDLKKKSPESSREDRAGEESNGQKGSPDRLNAAPDQPMEGIDIADVESGKAATQTAGKSEGRDSEMLEKAEGERIQASEQSEAGEGGEGERTAQQKQNRESEGGQQASSSAAESSLMSKLRDAMASLMSRLRQPQSASAAQAGSKEGQQRRASAQQQGQSQQGQAGQGRKQSGESGSESQEGQPGEEAAGAQSAEGKTPSQGGEDSSRTAASGIGRQDGSKDVKLAEQLEAMGKISEIIGKRSANVSGEITVEVRSGKQVLRTSYADGKATHGDRGGEIHRDEIPVAYQQYVQQYFAELRKQAKE
ncbi:MAG: hypothetical protein IT158_18050 [Bryobacterales bacterium]|nr:hypothetical protein [Bryobacterales bacterium]